MNLYTTPGFDELSYEDLARIANGCGPMDCKWCSKLLDNALGLCMFEACVQHDYDYDVGGDKKKKREDDIRFVCNLLVITLSVRSLWNFLRVPGLFFYYLAVHWGGHEHFNYHDREDSTTAQ